MTLMIANAAVSLTSHQSIPNDCRVYIQRLLRDSQRRRRKLFLFVEISFLLSGVLCALSGSAILGRSVSRNRGERADISAWMMVVVCVMTGWFLFCCGASVACTNSPLACVLALCS